MGGGDSLHPPCARLSLRMGIGLVSAVLAFDLCSILAPGVAGIFLGAGGAFTAGVVFAGVIVLAVVASAAVYVRSQNREDADSRTPGVTTDGA